MSSIPTPPVGTNATWSSGSSERLQVGDARRLGREELDHPRAAVDGELDLRRREGPGQGQQPRACDAAITAGETCGETTNWAPASATAVTCSS